MFVFAHLSDIHLGHARAVAGPRTGAARARERAERVLRVLDELPGALDAVLLTGDIADHGTDEEYAEAVKLLGGDPADTSPVNQVHRLPGATFLLCDSSIPGRGDGYLDDATLAWLDGQLAQGPYEVPAFVCFHHPPVPLHGQYVDPIRQFGEDRLAAVLDRHPHVAALLCGHSHTPAATTFAGLPLVAAPGVVSTLKMPWEGEEGGPIDYALPPLFAYHIHDAGRLTTHFRVVP